MRVYVIIYDDTEDTHQSINLCVRLVYRKRQTKKKKEKQTQITWELMHDGNNDNGDAEYVRWYYVITINMVDFRVLFWLL